MPFSSRLGQADPVCKVPAGSDVPAVPSAGRRRNPSPPVSRRTLSTRRPSIPAPPVVPLPRHPYDIDSLICRTNRKLFLRLQRTQACPPALLCSDRPIEPAREGDRGGRQTDSGLWRSDFLLMAQNLESEGGVSVKDGNREHTVQESGRPFYRRIPGYRSGRPWKMVAATVIYGFILIVVIAGLSSGRNQEQKPVPQPGVTRPAPQPSATQPLPQLTTTQPAPQSTATQPAPQPATTRATPQPIYQLQPQQKGVRLVGEPQLLRSQYGVRYVVGRIKNDTDRTLGFVAVKINLYDSAGVQVGNTSDFASNLEPGAVWEFKALVTEEKAVRFVVKEITAR